MTRRGFLDSAHRDESKDLEHDFIRPNHYRDHGWSVNFYGVGSLSCQKVL